MFLDDVRHLYLRYPTTIRLHYDEAMGLCLASISGVAVKLFREVIRRRVAWSPSNGNAWHRREIEEGGGSQGPL
jgi:hypothetical protein